MNIKQTIPACAKEVPKKRPFKAFAKLAVAGLLLINTPLISGCGGAEQKPVAKIAGPSIPKAMEGYTGYRIIGPEKTREKEETDGGVEEEAELPVREVKKLDRDPYRPTPVNDCPF